MYEPQNMKRNDKFGSNYWEVYSPKIKRVVRLFSDLEYDNYILVETNPKIETFCEQPVRLKVLIEEKEIGSVIDMWIRYKDGKESFIEVKYLTDIDPNNPKSKRSIRQINAQRKWCADKGIDHMVMTEKEIRGNQIFLINMKSLLSYIRHREKPILSNIERVTKIMNSQKLSIAEIIEKVGELPAEVIFESVCWMFYKDILKMNLETKELNLETEVWINAK